MASDDLRLSGAERKIRDLDSRLDEVAGRLEDLDSDHQSLSRKFGYVEDLDDDLRSIRSDISSCEERGEELGGRVADIDRTTKRLVQQVRLIESQMLASAGVQVADLDAFGKDQRVLARAMQRGWQAGQRLLPDYERSALQYRIRSHSSSVAQHQAHRAAVIDTIGMLAAARPGSADRLKAAQELPQALAKERQARQALQGQSSREEAEEALAADAEARVKHEPVMAEGAKAEQRLTLALRSRLADILSTRRVLPTWFVTVLGSAPPAHGTQKWLETATQVLLYRLTYNITDQVLALGTKPTSGADRHHGTRQVK